MTKKLTDQQLAAIRRKIRHDVGGRENHFRADRDQLRSRLSFLSDTDNVFLDRQLLALIPGMFARDYEKINARSVLPVYFLNDPGAEQIAWESVETVGEAEIVDSYADDAPTSEVRTGELKSAIRPIRMAAQWTIQDIRATVTAARRGQTVSLPETKTMAARDAMLRKENSVAFQGDADFDLPGLFTDTNIPRDTAAQTFAVGTANQNLDELGDLVDAQSTATNDIIEADTLLLPPSQHRKIARQKHNDQSETTVLELVRKTLPSVTSIVPVRECKGAGTGGVDVAVLFKRSIDVLRMTVAIDIEQLPAERRGAVVRVEYHMRIGGVLVHKPKAIRILENI